MSNHIPAEASLTPEQFHGKFPGVREPNTDCARDYACPHCGSRGPFWVQVSAFVELSDDDGYSFPCDLEETDAPPRCLECGYTGPGFIIGGLDDFLARLAKRGASAATSSGAAK